VIAVVAYTVLVRRLRPTWMGNTSEFNKLVKRALWTAGRLWLMTFRQRHFEPGAKQRYRYADRTFRWNYKKAYGRNPSRNRSRNLPLHPRQVQDLVYTGDLKAAVLGRPVDAFNIETTATSNRVRARVRVPLPHPLNPKNRGEVTRLNREEFRAMHREAYENLLILMDVAETRLEEVRFAA